LQRQQLTTAGVARAEEIKGSTLDCMASPACKVFSESCPRHTHRPRRLMYLALPLKSKPGVTSNFHRHMRYRSDERKFWLERNHSGVIRWTCGRPVLWRIGKSGPKRVRHSAPPTLGRGRRRRLERCQQKVVCQSVPPGTVPSP